MAGGVDGPNTDRALPALLPDHLVGNSLGGLPIFLGAILLILGVLTVGGEYGWGTWKTVLTQGPTRLQVYVGKLLALAVAALGVVLAVFAVGAVAAALIASAEAQPVRWPSAGDLVVGVGAGWLVATMWAMLGGVLAVALRAVALPVGLGLVWMLARRAGRARGHPGCRGHRRRWTGGGGGGRVPGGLRGGRRGGGRCRPWPWSPPRPRRT